LTHQSVIPSFLRDNSIFQDDHPFGPGNRREAVRGEDNCDILLSNDGVDRAIDLIGASMNHSKAAITNQRDTRFKGDLGRMFEVLTAFSEVESRAEVAIHSPDQLRSFLSPVSNSPSSRRRIDGCRTKALAMDIRCLCPPLKLAFPTSGGIRNDRKEG